MRPPPDALAEFSLQTSNYSREFGHSLGAVMNASIKSGTQQIHGDVWEYLRNTSLMPKAGMLQTIPPLPIRTSSARSGRSGFRAKIPNLVHYCGAYWAQRTASRSGSIHLRHGHDGR